MRARDQLIVAAVLAAATYFGILRIAEAKCDEAVGSLVTPIRQSSFMTSREGEERATWDWALESAAASARKAAARAGAAFG